MKKPSLIFLTGFSTSGKSTIGPLLANSLGFEFIDIDKEIVDREQKSINEIFAEKGEPYFRELEYNVLSSISQSEDLVVALGGGTLENDKCFEFIRKAGTLVYLKSDVATLARRLSHKEDRPLMKGENGEKLSIEDISDRVEKLLAKREPRYSAAEILALTDKTPLGVTIENLTRQIERHIRANCKTN
ncbi:Shikimate kinase [Chloroherpeton thalassium ATCC 35110]|uniref:Shikimate kinase n=1 Tax=Chloroherpeton thalassium (strain ATCC 35110 / GB-78) TaxID=517418 RepID=AROK_CHLT3|nr:shikimate kinase [Chloroherpeton thalassium]B3QSZ9.1 RecName: Full=Shikimate kinase; Short=SK [Chloroherpeton thalassium ATCC 35110]ACF12642.1 Shikimate kinase [Chloroherpeton thalassium ATCC 35110]